MELGMRVGLGPGHTALDGDPAPPKKGGTAPNFRPMSVDCCGQTAGWIKMPHGTKVGLGLGHNVLHGDPAPPKGYSPQIFGPCLLWPNSRPSQLLPSTCFSKVLITSLGLVGIPQSLYNSINIHTPQAKEQSVLLLA